MKRISIIIITLTALLYLSPAAYADETHPDTPADSLATEFAYPREFTPAYPPIYVSPFPLRPTCPPKAPAAEE